jgi:pimeloyl-ACP methyl ester carboxylesterase
MRESCETIAYLRRPGKPPGILWLGGFKSEMSGTKATALDAWAARRGRALLRFDYFGHGQSSGNFRAGTITRWRDDALAVLDRLAAGPQILVGSSMGGWIALLAARERPERVKAMLLIAPAVDFTEDPDVGAHAAGGSRRDHGARRVAVAVGLTTPHLIRSPAHWSKTDGVT